MDKGQTILSPGGRSPEQGSHFSGSKVDGDLLSWRECGSPVDITQQSKENSLILEMRQREQRKRRQRDEALKHCGDMLRTGLSGCRGSRQGRPGQRRA